MQTSGGMTLIFSLMTASIAGVVGFLAEGRLLAAVTYGIVGFLVTYVMMSMMNRSQR